MNFSEDRIPPISEDRILFSETIGSQVTESLNFYFLIYEVTITQLSQGPCED